MIAHYDWPETYLDRFFQRMATIWPGWGNGAEQGQWRLEWREVLQAMDPQRINAVINFCRDEYVHKPSFAEVKYAYQQVSAPPPAARPYFRALPPSPTVADVDPAGQQRVTAAVHGILTTLRASRPRRYIKPTPTYQAALRAARIEGKAPYWVDLEFLSDVGWTEGHEQQYLHDVRVLAFGNPDRFFPAGHAPPPEVLHGLTLPSVATPRLTESCG